MNLGGPDELTYPHPDSLREPHDCGPAAPQDITHTPPAPEKPMASFGSRYEPRGLLGRGGMAEVHLAYDTRLNRTVAVKILRPDLTDGSTFHARFRAEAKSTASLNHPAIAAVYDTGEDMENVLPLNGGGIPRPYIVMEYVDGMTLREILHAGTPLTIAQALEMTIDILRALAHAHSHGIIHRDVKPANVMLTRAGQIKVMDFGIARDLRDVGVTEASVVVGTAQYLSPEQGLGQTIDARSDLYSVGCLLYELLTFRALFTGESPVAVIYQHVHSPPPAPSLENSDVDTQLDQVVLTALAKDRADRYQSAEEMLADIEACLEAQQVIVIHRQPEPADSERHGTAPAKRQRGGNIALTCLGIAVVVVAVLLGWSVSRHGWTSTASVDVPQLVGETLEDGRLIADKAGLSLTVSGHTTCEDQPAGHICAQTPTEGRLEKGESVRVTVSTGGPKVEVPDVTYKPEEDATRILNDKGFNVETRRVESSHEAGTVLEQDPAGGETVDRGTVVTVTVSKEPATARVPDLVGETLDDAEELLAQRGLRLGDTTEVESSQKAGTVIKQSIAEGEEVKDGTAVDVQVAKQAATVVLGNLTGMTLGDAEDYLANAGLHIYISSGSSRAADSIVVTTTPVAGSEVTLGSTVTVATGTSSQEPSQEPEESESPSPTASTPQPPLPGETAAVDSP
ncbi:PASTA domain-containing protein [Streptomyces sp. NPDC127084]|uniref:Stk1 family PASTA domain-containing Ser/Thr kinase n=1 Tax=Streptomyces sp. NPDC127084 TaxID=3347133 RepID=UPI003664E397